MSAPSGPHRRYNPLLDEWVLCSPHRLERPWQGQTETSVRETLPAYDPDCYLCPGNARAKGEKNPGYATTFAFDNDFPALLASSTENGPDDGLLVARAEAGRCRVLCFTPYHDLSLARMSEAAIRNVVELWAEEHQALARDGRFAYVQLFENKGALMGCSNPHPHCQVWATEHVPTLPARKLERQRVFFEKNGRDLLGAVLERELRERERVVCENAHWVCVVPFWAVWPFETLLLPKRTAARLPDLDGEARAALADALKELLTRYDALYGVPFPYSMGWHQAPFDGISVEPWLLHAHFYPPLLRSTHVRKFMVGYELLAEPQRDLTAEEAAATLRAAL